jgi:hypothetical protein
VAARAETLDSRLRGNDKTLKELILDEAPHQSRRGVMMLILRPAYQYAVVLALITCCKPAEAQQKLKPAEAPQKATLSSLTGDGFEIKGTLSISGVNMILVQKDKDAFACNIFQSKDSSYASTCFPIR